MKPKILLSIPENISIKQEILNNYLSFAFPNGIEPSFNSKKPLIYSIVLTNEKGTNLYLYILLFYEKVIENDLINSSLYTLNNQKPENIYYPVSIILISYYSNIDFYRKLLIEFYSVIKMDLLQIINNSGNLILNNFSNNKNKEKIKNFQKLEFLNYLHFCCELLRPPNKSIFTMNMRFNSLECKFNSILEMPSNDFCIDLLFNALEISTIIKLFIALLFEKQIIIISNQNLPLFCIGESLKLLLFPLRWPHIYIPNLPYDQIRFLESPIPYIMGINSPLIDIQSLTEQFPSHIICDVNTSSLYGNLSNLSLPIKEENRIKTQLLKLKFKYNNYDEINYGNLNNSFNDSRKTNSRDTINTISDKYEEIDFQLSFAQNVQNIFFDLFKNNLANIKKEYISGNLFNSKKFLNSFKDPEYKFFFEKLINTLIFEDFIFSMQYFDDSYSRQYNNIVNENQKKSNALNKNNKYYIYEFKMRKNIKEKSIKQNDKIKINLVKDYNEISDIFEKNYKKLNTNNNNNYFNENQFIKKKYNSFKETKFCKSDIYMTTIKYLKEKDNEKYTILNFYGKDNFIKFYQNNNQFFLYHKIIYKEINQIYEEISSSYDRYSDYKMIPIKTYPTKITKELEEKEREEEREKLADIPINYSYQLYNIISFYLCHNIEYEKNNPNQDDNEQEDEEIILQNTISSNLNINNIYNENNNINGKITEEKNLNINNEISNKINKNKKNNSPIINLFIKAFKKNRHEFPRNIFYTLLNDFSLDELKKVKKTNIKYIDKTIQYKIDKIEKISYKAMVINMDSDIEEMTDDEHQIQKYNSHKKTEDFSDTKFMELINKNNSPLSTKENEEKENEEKKNDEKNNIQRTKINVIDDSNLVSYGNNQQNNNNKDYHNKISKIYKTSAIVFNDMSNGKNCYSNLFMNNNNDINFYNNINLFNDPLALSEKICIELYSFLCKEKIENYNIKNYDINFFKDLAYSEEFEEIKKLIVSLKNVSLDNLSSNPINYFCFWLNMYNFLTIFSVIYKCEIISTNYEWYRFLKNSYFDIGNQVISLYEMESYILRGREISKRIYTNIVDNTQFKTITVEKIEDNLINYGISLPTISSPIIRIYYPFNFINSLKMNEIEFFSRNINYNTQDQRIEIPEYSIWIEPKFIENLKKYEYFFNKGIYKFMNNNLDNIDLTKYDWKLNFVNFKNLQSNK